MGGRSYTGFRKGTGGYKGSATGAQPPGKACHYNRRTAQNTASDCRIRETKEKRRRIFEVEDEILEKRDALIKELEMKMMQKVEKETLFMIEWEIV